MDEARVTFEWTLDDEEGDDASALAAELEKAGGEVQVKDRPVGVIPVPGPEAIFGIVVLTGLVQQIFDWWSRRRRKGLFIHKGADGKVEVKPVDIPYGQVLFLTPDGTTLRYQDVSRDRLSELLAAAAGGDVPTGGTETEAPEAGAAP